jgi:SAM-dependent methyltransferase
MTHRKEIAGYPALADWYNQKYVEMHGAWVTPPEDCNQHLDDMGVPVDQSRILLDIGCGGGHFIEQAAKRVQCVGIELSSVVLEHAKRRCAGLPVRLAIANIEHLKGPTQFDYITSIGSLEHVFDIDAALESIHRLLKPDGMWYFYLPNTAWVHQDQPNELLADPDWWVPKFAEHELSCHWFKQWGKDNIAYCGTAVPLPGGACESTVEVAGPAVDMIQQRAGILLGKIGVNIGSGQRPFQTKGGWVWINIDKQPRWTPDIVADGADLSRYVGSNSVDCVVLHHVLEHFWPHAGNGLLRECYRILRPGGSLIVTVPDMTELALVWLGRRKEMNTQLYMTNVYGAFRGDEADLHKWGFNRQSLEETICAAGFGTVEPFNNRKIPGADIVADWWILGMEGIK